MPYGYGPETSGKGKSSSGGKGRKGKDGGCRELNKIIIKSSDAVMKGERTIADFLAEVDSKLDRMNEVNLSTALHRVAKLCRNRGLDYIEQTKRNPHFGNLHVSVRAATLQAIQWLGSGSGGNQVPMGTACVCWAHATLRMPDAGLFAEVAARCAPHLDLFKNLEVANLLWAFAKLGEKGQRHADLFNAAAKRATDQPEDFTVVNLSTLAWSFATARVKNKNFFSLVAQRLVQHVAEAESQEIANSLWAFATAGVYDRALFARIGDEAAGKLETFKPQEASNAAWAYGRARISHPWFFEALDWNLKARTRSDEGLTNFEPQHLAQILVAIASLYPANPEAEDPLARRDGDEMDEEASDAEEGGSGSGQAAGECQVVALSLAVRLLPECLRKARRFKSDEVARLHIACSRLSLDDDGVTPVNLDPEQHRFACQLAKQFKEAAGVGY